jgi:AraC-like DNA-binding protein
MSAINSDKFFIASLEKINAITFPFAAQKRETYIELILVTAGYLVRNSNTGYMRINSKEIHLAVTQQPACIGEKANELRGWYCRFNDFFLEMTGSKKNLTAELDLIDSFLHQYPLSLTNRAFLRLSTHFDAIFKLYSEPEHDFALIHAYLMVCIYEIRKLLKENNLDFYPAKAFSITKQYSDLLLAHIGKKHDVGFYAQTLKITPNHLNKSVKLATGKTAVAFFNEIRLTEAQLRLKNTDLPVSEIAYQLGFEDPSYFSRFFKKSTGYSPTKFRNCGLSTA